jgi:hypothetical protein
MGCSGCTIGPDTCGCAMLVMRGWFPPATPGGAYIGVLSVFHFSSIWVLIFSLSSIDNRARLFTITGIPFGLGEDGWIGCVGQVVVSVLNTSCLWFV